MYNYRVNMPTIVYLQQRVRSRIAHRRLRAEVLGKLLTVLINKRWSDGFKLVRMKSPNEETMKRITEVYRENVIFK
jgi:hypothetical protein